MATSDENKIDPEKLQWLSRKLLWVENPSKVNWLVYGLFGICGCLFLADFFYKRKVYLDLEGVPGFYAIYALIICVLIVIFARGMRAVLMRDETYYAPKDVESEAYPEHDMERRDFDA